MPNPEVKIAYFGTPEFSTLVLDELEKADLSPALVVTQPDRPAGRGMELKTSPVKQWALARTIPVLQHEDMQALSSRLSTLNFDVFVVAAYGKIIPREVLGLPRYGTLNVHPSLLPKYRGPSPIEQQILDDAKEVGVSVILLDEETDHGPILAQKAFTLSEPKGRKELETLLWNEGGALLAQSIPPYLEKTLEAQTQEHSKATFTPKLSKEDGLLDLSGDARKNYLKYLAYEGWPGTYFFADKNGKQVRVKITDAEFAEGTFRVKRVIPEGKREMSYEDFVRSAR